jgi:hypothetical protein
MKLLLIVLVIFSGSAFSNEKKFSSNAAKENGKENAIQKIVKEGKKERRKRVQMCHDCGKPEPECTCEGH